MCCVRVVDKTVDINVDAIDLEVGALEPEGTDPDNCRIVHAKGKLKRFYSWTCAS